MRIIASLSHIIYTSAALTIPSSKHHPPRYSTSSKRRAYATASFEEAEDPADSNLHHTTSVGYQLIVM